ncbi:hypothetical protein D3C72_137920 [compost metagenome]
MAAKRTLGWVSGVTLASLMAGCASQTPSMTAPEYTFPNNGPAIIEGDTLIIPGDTRSGLQVSSSDDLAIKWTAADFATLPARIAVASVEARNLIPSGGMGEEPAPEPGPGPVGPPPLAPGIGPGLGIAPGACGPGAFALNFPGVWAGPWAAGGGFCAAPFGFAFGTPGIFPKTLFISPDVYYFRRNALYFPYSRLGGYFYPISVPFGARFYTPILAYGFGGFSPYTFTSSICPLPAPFPGPLPGGPGVGPGIGGPGAPGGYIPPGGGNGGYNGGNGGYDGGQGYGKHMGHGKHMAHGKQQAGRRY